MEEKPRIRKRFFKIMLPGFHERLNLPQDLCKNLAEEISLPEQAILETRLGKWRIRVCRNRDGLIWFQNGWPDFAHHHELNVGDLVVFEPTGNFQFKVVVFDISAVEKEFLEHPIQGPPTPKPEPTNGKQVSESGDTAYDSEDPFFILRMSSYHANRAASVRVPPKFMRDNNIEDMRSVIVRDPRAREWTVHMRWYVEKKGKCHCRWGRGWHDFYKGNKLKDGDVCIFQLRKSEYLRSSKVVLDVEINPKTMLMGL